VAQLAYGVIGTIVQLALNLIWYSVWKGMARLLWRLAHTAESKGAAQL
jgi:hypothetical protein